MQVELFPREVTSGVPRLTLTGHERLHIEQHRGLIDYEPENIVLRSSVGLIRIAGSGLMFCMYTAAEALIQGRIDSISFQHREGRK